jgi:NTE family protein
MTVKQIIFLRSTYVSEHPNVLRIRVLSIGLRGKNNNNRNDRISEPYKGPRYRDNELSESEGLSKNKDRKPLAYAGPEQIVYEGSKVTLEGSCKLYGELPLNSNVVFTWEPDLSLADPNIHIELDDPNTSTPSFYAPFVGFDFNKGQNNNPYTTLNFKLVVTDKRTGLSSDPSTVTIIVKMIQRALVLQGGGALGAYELGVYRALCERLIEKDKISGNRKNRPLFDIIAGASIGALNAALIVHSVKKEMQKIVQANGKVDDTDIPSIWERSVIELADFWCNITRPFPWLNSELFKAPWDWANRLSKAWLEIYTNYFAKYSPPLDLRINYLNPFYLFFRPEIYAPIATGESARRYFSWLYYPYLIPMHSITPNFVQPDTRFFLGIPAFARFSNSPLVETVTQHYWDADNEPIRTSFGNGEPRLLLVTVDVLDATSAATFDSYLCETRYGDGRKSIHNKKEEKNEHILNYQDGITMQHVRASMSPNLALEGSKLVDEAKNETRYFWDGAYLSNTPLRELLHLHRFYWYNKKIEEYKKAKAKLKENTKENNDVEKKRMMTLHVPHLEIYIINLYPTVEERTEPPKDADTIQDRELDIRFHDKTKYDKKVAEMITDYLILHGQIKNLALKHLDPFDKSKVEDFEKDYEELLEDDRQTHSSKRSASKKRNFRDLIEGRFDVTRVVYIDREDDQDTIFGKAADFSRETIVNLEKKGYDDAQRVIQEHSDLIVHKDGSYKIPIESRWS